MLLNNTELQKAKEMNQSGISWSIIAAYYKTNRDQLRKQIKHYEEAYK